ncbi:MAG: response regulator [Elusimicrobia bacterium]|nr:response regulator [Elusimicrobiota bacterium]
MDKTGKILLITTDNALAQALVPAFSGRGLELVVSPTPRHAAIQLGLASFAAIVADYSRIPAEDRQGLRRLRQQSGAALFTLDTLATISPSESLPLRRVPYPFPAGFADQIRAAENPVVFLVDQSLFASRAVQSGLQMAGVPSLGLESAEGLVEALMRQPPPTNPSRPRSKSFWEMLGSSRPEASEEAPRQGHVAVLQFPADLAQAEAFDASLREALPGTVCYQVSSLDPVRAASKAVSEGAPACLMREQAGRIAGILCEDSRPQSRPKETERILLLDNYKPTLESLTQTLTAAGYQVTAAMDGELALKLARGRDSFHLAVIGTALAYAQQTGAELAQKLRELDPDLRIIFMVDRYPVKEALQGVSQVVELGLDDALLKPVEASRLLFSVQRALERRFLILENARLFKEVQESNRKLAQINGFQTKFFAMVAHDVKNPLAAIIGYSELLGMRLKNLPNELKCASHIHSAAQTLTHLISDLVDLAAIESGKLRVTLEPLDLAAVIQEVRSRVEVPAAQRRIRLSVEMPPTLPALSGDPARLGQVVQNLCTNAIQYTPEGGLVTVRVDADASLVRVGVRDTGIGISKEDLPRVFERFFQTQEAQKMRKAGFGLGLKIAREIIQMHGGDMGVESELGKGSFFYFTLPVQKAKS